MTEPEQNAELVLIEDVNVDLDYQRTLRHDLVNKIAGAYDIVKAGAILVSQRDDGTLWCVDGQHRMVGAQQAGETHVFAEVIRGRTKQQEADIRLARNDRKSDTIAEKFQTRLVMGDLVAEAINEIVHQNGSQVNLSPNTYSGINAIACLETLYLVDGKGVVLARTLRFLREAFGEDRMDAKTCSNSMLKSIAWFIDRHVDSHEVPWSEAVTRVAAADVEDLRRKAVSHKAANGGSLWLNHYRALVEVWNYRRQDAKKIQWKTRGSLRVLGEHGSPRASGFEYGAN